MRTNLVSNPSFELGTDGWSSNSGVASLGRASSTDGPGTGRAVIVGTTPAGSSAYVLATDSSVTAGQWVAAAVRVRRSASAGLYVSLTVQMRSGSTIVATSPHDWAPATSLPLTDPASVKSAAFQVPAGATSVRPIVWYGGSAVGGSAPDGFVSHLDAVIMAIGESEAAARAALEPYFDGSTPSTPELTYSWTGAPHASASTEGPTPGLRVERLPDAGAPQAGITVTGLAPSSESVISVQVSWDGGRSWHGVRGAEHVGVTGGDFFRDHVPPLNVPARYRLVVHKGPVTPLRLEDTITIESDSVWIQDPLSPRGAVEVECVRTGAGLMLMTGTASRIVRRQVIDITSIEGSRYPVASVGIRQAPSGVPLTLRAVVASQGALIASMRDLLDVAGQFVIRGLPLDIPLDPVAHVVAGDVEEVPVVGGLLGFRNDWELSVTQVRPTSMRIVIPWWTYDQVRALWSPRTYDQVEAARPGTTYLDWSRDPEVP
ncbi:hypothetical protein [Oerskovia rustica]|uniref:Minor tail protein n=1 Tax=Oerskovia rustica TaxID=2762237 RepID=A0ABR8RP69_9CELL|nr:hypothetical protein [Oerskovia rustica]MBD7949585.1 hypothetical protein [Oerskovia rustica]